ncbi:dorsal-ventral patterning tolloid-like protein 1 isoform X1 [Branchiostoma lanceolatum]|uniref:dorsal-ventral patterning tolloid-like protein 1 isoform X1 n=1 Tax=Branchiostoma lanceolatum TaxID=7740 RepID=UPI0034571151
MSISVSRWHRRAASLWGVCTVVLPLLVLGEPEVFSAYPMEFFEPTRTFKTRSPYGDSTTNEWLANCPVRSDNGCSIRIRFKKFDLQDSKGCRADYLEVHRGPNASYPSLGRFCGGCIPNDLYVLGRNVFVRFVSDSAISGLGAEFDMSVLFPVAEVCNTTLRCSNGKCLADSLLCNGRDDCPMSNDEDQNICAPYDELQQSSVRFMNWGQEPSKRHYWAQKFEVGWTKGEITFASRLFPQPYPENFTSYYDLRCSTEDYPDCRVKVVFDVFNVGRGQPRMCRSSSCCKTNYMEARDGRDEKAPLIGRYCGCNMPRRIAGTGPFLWMKLKSGFGQRSRGIRATLSIMDPDEITTAEPTTPTPTPPETTFTPSPVYYDNCVTELVPYSAAYSPRTSSTLLAAALMGVAVFRHMCTCRPLGQ